MKTLTPLPEKQEKRLQELKAQCERSTYRMTEKNSLEMFELIIERERQNVYAKFD